MSLRTTIVAGSVSVVIPCMPVVLVVVVSVGSILIGVRTLILVLSMVCILASVWNVAVRVTGCHGFQWWALVCYLHEPSVDLLICLRYDVFKAMVFLLPWRFWQFVTRIGVMKEFDVTITSCVDHE